MPPTFKLENMVLEVLDSDYCSNLYLNEEFEKGTTHFIKQNVRPSEHIIDCGAHIGYYTCLFASLVGKEGRVWAYEPSPINFSLLQKNVKTNNLEPNVSIENAAVLDYTGTSNLFFSSFNSGDDRTFDSHDGRTWKRIKCIRLDDFHWPQIDWVKLDVQGSELRALNGMIKLIQDNPDLKFIMEFEQGVLRAGGTEPKDLLDFFVKRGYKFERINEHDLSVVPISENELLQMDTNVFIHK